MPIFFSYLFNVIRNQTIRSLINRAEWDAGLNECCSPKNENVALLPYSPLAGGILTGKYATKSDTSSCRLTLFPGYMARYKQSLAVDAVRKYCDYAKSIDLTPTELALGWCYKQAHVTSTIIGATSVKQLKENLAAFDESKWKRIDEAKIDEIHKQCKDPSKV
jgi:aryl-alcohol dehydrogenase-like predicted oxidoreductase